MGRSQIRSKIDIMSCCEGGGEGGVGVCGEWQASWSGKAFL